MGWSELEQPSENAKEGARTTCCSVESLSMIADHTTVGASGEVSDLGCQIGEPDASIDIDDRGAHVGEGSRFGSRCPYAAIVAPASR